MFKNYLKAARLRTLPLSISGIIVGCALVGNAVFIKTTIFWLALLTTIGFQVLSNFANDYGDGIKGTDERRKGEKRMVASGKISPKQMKKAMIWITIVTLFFAFFLIYSAFGSENFANSIIFFGLGIASIVAGIKYTVGKSAYGYSGFGDVFVFLFFGLLGVVGSYFLYTKKLNFQIFLPAISIGLLSTAVLNLNNLRDEKEDKKAQKSTLIVKLGQKRGKIYHYLLIFFALISALIFTFLTYEKAIQFVYLIAFIPLIKNCITIYKNQQPSDLDSELKKVALSTFLFAILFSLFQSTYL